MEEYRTWLTKSVVETIDEVLQLVGADDFAIIEPTNSDVVIVYTKRGIKEYDRKKHKVLDFLATLCENMRSKRIMVRKGGKFELYK